MGKLWLKSSQRNKSITICCLKIKSWTNSWREDRLKALRKEINELKKEKDLLNSKIESQNLFLRSSRRILRIIIKNSLTKQKLRNRRIASKSMICRNKTIHWKQRSKVRKCIFERKDEFNKVLVFQYNSSTVPIIRREYIRVLYISNTQLGIKYFGKQGSEYSIDKVIPKDFSTLKRMHSAMTGLQTNHFLFLFNNKIIKNCDNPKALVLISGSIIDVLLVIDFKNILIVNKKLWKTNWKVRKNLFD